ncbi:MAG: DegT/DnrJ/EryC1/StrS family aminotransferase [Cytophagales bacterium]|nr:DegT/DnrJ/EryC1/StrS family aminotransferase [Cytophagales bacterium]
MKRIPYIPFLHVHPELRKEMTDVFKQFYDGQQYISGPGLKQFENEYAKFTGVKYGVGVGNGHDAFIIILRTLGIGKGDEVIIPAHTFIATALSVINAGATPVLVDIDENTFNINPRLIEAKITARTKAVVPVHIYGNPCEMDEISSIAEKNNLFLIEDNAQGHGAEYKFRKTGSIGIMNFTSFYPTKNLGALGDGGLITTNSKELSDKAKAIRDYGKSTDGDYDAVGLNSRLDELQAKMLLLKLKYLEKWNEERIRIAGWYEEELNDLHKIQLQSVDANSKGVRHIFPILTQKRDDLKEYLKLYGVDTRIHYESPIHLQKSFSFLNQTEGSFPTAENLCRSELSLPIYPGTTREEILYICHQIRSFFALI